MRWQVACVLLLAVAAGCNALGGDPATPSPTVTPAPVPTAPATPDPDPSLAPGLATTGVTNVSALAESHVRAARNATWVWTETSIILRTTDDGTRNTTRLQTVRFVDERTYWRDVSRANDPAGGDPDFDQRYAAYADGAVVYETWFSPTAARTVYRRDDTPTVTGRFPGFAAGQIRRLLALDSATVSRVEAGPGRHYAVVGSRETVPGYGLVGSYRARAVVREDGFVRSLTVSFTAVRGGRRVDRRYSFRYRRLDNTTVDRPPWVAIAENRTGS